MKKRVSVGVYFVAILAMLLAVAAVAAPPQEKPCDQATATQAADRWDPNAAVPADGGQVLVKAVPAPAKSLAELQACSKPPQKGGGDDGLALQRRVAPSPSAVTATVLWDQPSNGGNGIIDQHFPDFGAGVYSADDFIVDTPWSIGTIFVDGQGSSLSNAVSLNWAIYADQPMDTRPMGPISTMALPDGYPGAGAAPIWSLSLAPSAPGVTLGGGNTQVTLDIIAAGGSAVLLSPGTYWLEFYPSLSFGSYGQWFWDMASTTNGSIAQVVDPTNLLGSGWTNWVPWTLIDTSAHDAAFRLETPSCPSYTYDNGPLVTHPGGGSGGADASVLQTALSLNSYGFGHAISTGYRVADDFVVTDSAGWDVNTIQFYAYQTGSTTTSTINNINYRIWNGDPSNPASSVVFGDTTTNRLMGSVWSNIYRVVDYSMMDTNRPIMVSTVSCGTHLAPGTYWLDWQVGGTLSSGPWAPPISILGQTTTGNGLQYYTSWAAALDAGTLTQQGLPFKVNYSVCVVCPTIDVYPYTLPTPTVGVPYTVVFSAYGGTEPYTFAVTAGTLPPGLTLARTARCPARSRPWATSPSR